VTPLLTAEEVAEMLRMPKSAIYAMTREGQLPTVRLGRYYRYRSEAIRQWVEEQES
jgi:excisionase family DNA binding protein